uniref:Uncharacterized protein n=1 Tax=Hyaloperonospora arabidopsidis (strain Emoy2) TaxID=559515 RepID=M4BRI6_HYAAE
MQDLKTIALVCGSGPEIFSPEMNQGLYIHVPILVGVAAREWVVTNMKKEKWG